jgi:FkbM family methyltransferase
MSKPKNEYVYYGWVDMCLRWAFRHIRQSEKTQNMALWWGFKYRGVPKIVRLRTGQLMRVDPTDYLQCLIYYFGMFEPHCINIALRLLKTGDTFIDIGGNIGLFSIVASSVVGKTGKVYTFEPAPFHCETIKKNIQLNNFSNIRLFETALGSESGYIELVLPQGGNQGSLSIASSTVEDSVVKATVPISKLDNIVHENNLELDNLSLIKMDIEGAEMMALSGMTDLLKKFPSVLIEFNQSALSRLGSDTKTLYNWFVERSYRGWIINQDGRLESIPNEGVNFAECIFVHSNNKLHLKVIGQF